MAFECELQILVQPGATGNQTYSLSRVTVPKAVILWAVPLAADGTGASWAYGIGFGTYRGSAVQQRFTTMRSLDASASNDGARGAGSDALFVLQTQSAGASTRDLEIDLVSMSTAPNVILNWVNLHTTASIRIFMLVLGGSNVTDALVDDFNIVTGAATQDETVVTGFGKPELVFFMGEVALTENTASPSHQFGFAKQGEPGRGWAFALNAGITTSQTATRQRSDRCIMDITADSATAGTDRSLGQLDTTVANWPTDGFRVVWDANPLAAANVCYLALRTTAQIATGSNTAVIAGTPPVNQDNNAGFVPKLGFVFGWNLAALTTLQATAADQCGFGIGAYDGTTQAWAGFTEDDAAATMVSKEQQETDHILANYSVANVIQSSAVASFSGNNLRLAWDDIDTVAREYQWLAMGDAAAVTTSLPPIRQPFAHLTGL